LPHANSDVEDLLRRAAAGDVTARELLLARHRDRLRRMVALRIDGRMSSRVDPSDVVQDVMIEACRLLPEYLQSRPIAFYPWLKQLALKRLVDLHRRHVVAQQRSIRRESRLHSDADETTRSLADQFSLDELAAAHLIRQELRERLHEAIQQLPEHLRDVLVQRHLNHKSISEIAREAGVAEATVRTRQFRALTLLRELLAEQSSGDR
jgi:RNA polymerase sigma-70 factor, ECF subfamily